MADILSMEGFDIVIQEDGQKALSFLQTEPCDLILTDIVMPNMDGITLIKKVRSDKSLANMPIIVISAKTTEETKKEAAESGSNLFLNKPCDTENLINSVKALLAL